MSREVSANRQTLTQLLEEGAIDIRASEWVETALSAAITHNDPASIAACVAFVSMPWELIGMTAAPESEWWVNSYVRVAKELEHRED